MADLKERGGDVEVTVDLSPNLPKVHGDLHQLTQLFTNLLTNAYEAMDGRGRVGVTAGTIRLDDGMEGRDAVVVGFADDGPGMPPDIAEHIFDPFFTTKPQGSGLGLAIVRKIVDAHDGQIDLHTTPGRGTTIHVTLPVGAVEGSE